MMLRTLLRHQGMFQSPSFRLPLPLLSGHLWKLHLNRNGTIGKCTGVIAELAVVVVAPAVSSAVDDRAAVVLPTSYRRNACGESCDLDGRRTGSRRVVAELAVDVVTPTINTAAYDRAAMFIPSGH